MNRPDPLPTRIASAMAVIECEDRCGTTFGKRPCDECRDRCLPAAYLVIHDLGLRQEITVVSAGWIGGDKTKSRYVTDWSSND